MGSVIMCHVCKSSQKWNQGPKQKRGIFAGTKNYIKNYGDYNQNEAYLQGPKPYFSLCKLIS